MRIYDRKFVCIERILMDGTVTREYVEESLAHFILYYNTAQNGLTIKSAKIVKNLANDEIPLKYDFSF